MNLNVAQIAARFGCSTDAVYGMIERGDLPAFRVGAKLWRVRLEDVVAWENGGGHSRSTAIAAYIDRPTYRPRR